MAPPRKRHTGVDKKDRIQENGNHADSHQGRKNKKTTGIPYTWKGVAFVVLAAAIMLGFYMYNTRKTTTEQQKHNRKQHDSKSTQGNQKVKFKEQNKPHKTNKQGDKTMNAFDRAIARDLNQAKTLLDKGKIEDALGRYRLLAENNPQSPHALYGKAISLDKLADHRKSNDLLQECIQGYRKVSNLPDCPLELKRLALTRMADRLSFFGQSRDAADVLEKLAALFPRDEKIWNDLGIQYLMFGENKEATRVFKKVLSIDPNSGFAKSHLGFALKVQLHYEEAIPFLAAGIKSGDLKADDGRFYFHLGDALTRTGKPDEAYTWYVEAANKGIFMSPLQRSLYNADTPLKAMPWWTPEETGYAAHIRKLEENWQAIRDEGLAIMDRQTGGFIPEEENLRDKGDWRQFTLYQQGRKLSGNCKKTPRTCAIMDTIPDATRCKRGQIKFSVMHPGTHVWPHTGPTNCRLRSHLGLVIPQGVAIRVGTITKTWQEGKAVIIDDSIDHEVWHNGTSFRLIFIVDFWHPELSPRQRATLSPI